MRAKPSLLLAAFVATSCHRRHAIEHEPKPVVVDASRPGPPPPVGEVALLVGAGWGGCARTSTGRVWCFSSSGLHGRVIDAFEGAADLVGVGGSFRPDEDTRCGYCGVCSRTSAGLVTCASNVRSADLAALCGPPSGRDGDAANQAACEAPFDDLRVEGVRAIGVAHTGEYRAAFCDPDAGRAISVGVLMAGDTDLRVVPFFRRPGSTCCQSLRDLLGSTCAPVGPLFGCGVPYAQAPVSWIDGLARMGDGTLRRLPVRAGDELPVLRDTVRMAHAEALACAIDASGAVRCMNEPQDGVCPYGPRPSYRDWHVVKGLDGTTDLAIVGGPWPAVCVLRSGAPWCWGLDGLATDGREPAPARHVLGQAATEKCSVAYGEGPMPNHCVRKPKRLHDITDAVQIVAIGDPDGFCVRRSAGRISCWGAGTNGALKDVTPP